MKTTYNFAVKSQIAVTFGNHLYCGNFFKVHDTMKKQQKSHFRSYKTGAKENREKGDTMNYKKIVIRLLIKSSVIISCKNNFAVRCAARPLPRASS